MSELLLRSAGTDHAVQLPDSPLSTGRASPPRSWRVPPAWLLTAFLGAVYLVIAPASPDLAAASYRSYLFGRFGFLLWDNSWYGGHHLPAYSLLAPALGDALAGRVASNLADFDVLAERDSDTITRLAALLAEGRPIVVPQLDQDVQDLLGLARVAEYLFQ